MGSGDRLVALDGSEVPLLVGAVPLYRPLSEGFAGPDVAELNSFLAILGLGGAGVDVVEFTDATTRAVEAFDRQSARAPDGVFDPEDVVFAPIQVTIRTWSVPLGADIVAGASLATTLGPTERVQIVAPSAPGLAEIGADVPVTLSADGDRLSVSSTAPDEPAELAEVGAFLERHHIAEVSDGSPDPAVAPAPDLSVELTTAVRHGSVPATAVVSSGSRDCVIVRRPGGRLRAQTVVLMPSPEAGVAYVDTDVIGLQVLVDAAAASAGSLRSCR